jgi:hypothetical protein
VEHALLPAVTRALVRAAPLAQARETGDYTAFRLTVAEPGEALPGGDELLRLAGFAS